ncbi:unnamed protein product [Absidia cylindrospora]
MDFCFLSKFDNLFTDIFLDAQFLWFDTVKLNTDHRRPRIRSDKVLKTIQDHVLTTGKTNEAVKELLRMDYFKHYLAAKSTKQRQEFIHHMKRYLYMYMPNAGYEIADTKRYGGAGRRVEACVMVTKDWNFGDELRLCTGMIAHLNPRQERDLKKANNNNRDISVMWSSRRQCNCLFLGPARFVNHDCNPNAEFISLGPNSVTFRIIKDIKCGDELTVYYGKHYVGANNHHCRCATCETRRVGQSGSDDEDGGANSTDNEGNVDYLSRSRKRKSTSYEDHLWRKKQASDYRIDLEDLIGIVDDNEEDDADTEDGSQSDNNNNGSSKQIQHIDTPSKLTETNQEQIINDDNKPQVMSIHFLCNENNKKRQEQQDGYSTSRSSSYSHSPLDLLCNAVLDAEYLQVQHQQPNQEEITVVVGPEIHKDATDRLMQHPGNQQQQHLHQQRWQSMDEDNSSDTKADSAVGLSPQLQHQDIHHHQKTKAPPSSVIHTASNTTKASTRKKSTTTASSQWQNDMDSLFDNDEQLSELDDFMDDVSDLSSVCSSDLTLNMESINKDQKDLQLSTPSPSPVSHIKKSSSASPITTTRRIPAVVPPSAPTDTNNSNNKYHHHGDKSGLNCMACGRALKSETISDESAADVAVANELATWTWSPSAAFTDWRPQRCPRCERHVRVFTQEWPARKINKKKATVAAAASSLQQQHRKMEAPSVNKKRTYATKKHPCHQKKSEPSFSTTSHVIGGIKTQQASPNKAAATTTTMVTVSRKSFVRSPPTPTSEIFDGVDDLF